MDTSLITIFLNRCYLAFKQMMFENLSELKNSLEKYLAGDQDYEYPLAPLAYEKWIQESAGQIERSMTDRTAEDQLAEIKELTRDATWNKSLHMRHLLTSLVHMQAKND